MWRASEETTTTVQRKKPIQRRLEEEALSPPGETGARDARGKVSPLLREKKRRLRVFLSFLCALALSLFFSLCTLLLFFKGERSCTRARLRMHMGTSYFPFPADNLGSQSEFSVVNGLYSAVVKIGRQRNFIPVIKPSAVRVVARCDRVNR